MKYHCVLYVFNTYERAAFASNNKRLKLEEDGYVHEYKRYSNSIDVLLASGDLLRLYYVAVDSIQDAQRQLAGHQFFMTHFQLDGLFTGEIIAFTRTRERGKAPESEPVRRGDLWQVINRG